MRKVPENFSLGGDKDNASKAWLDGYDTAMQDLTTTNSDIKDCPHCGSKETHKIHRPQFYEFDYICRSCHNGFN